MLKTISAEFYLMSGMQRTVNSDYIELVAKFWQTVANKNRIFKIWLEMKIVVFCDKFLWSCYALSAKSDKSVYKE